MKSVWQALGVINDFIEVWMPSLTNRVSISSGIITVLSGRHHPAFPQCGQGLRTTRRHSTPPWTVISCGQ